MRGRRRSGGLTDAAALPTGACACAAALDGSGADACGALAPPAASATCHACNRTSAGCQNNGCWGLLVRRGKAGLSRSKSGVPIAAPAMQHVVRVENGLVALRASCSRRQHSGQCHAGLDPPRPRRIPAATPHERGSSSSPQFPPSFSAPTARSVSKSASCSQLIVHGHSLREGDGKGGVGRGAAPMREYLRQDRARRL